MCVKTVLISRSVYQFSRRELSIKFGVMVIVGSRIKNALRSFVVELPDRVDISQPNRVVAGFVAMFATQGAALAVDDGFSSTAIRNKYVEFFRVDTNRVCITRNVVIVQQEKS
jgi:hypothetical protein